MSEARIFQIEAGQFALSLVDTAAVGYSDAWDAPGGKTAATATLADYEADSAHWMCQVTSAALNSSANDNDVTVPATFCQASKQVPQPGETSYTLDAEFLQDPILLNGLSQFLFTHDTAEAYGLLGLNDGDPPQAVFRVRLQAGSFGGVARENLTATVSLKTTRKPDIAWGTEAPATMMAADMTSAKSEPDLVGV